MNQKLTAKLLAGVILSSSAVLTSTLAQPVRASEESDLLTLAANTSSITEAKANGGETLQTVKSSSTEVQALTFTSSNPVASSNTSIGKTAQSELPRQPQLIAGSGVGMASFYSQGDDGGSVTATGERYNHHGYTAAHRTLPFGTKVRVTNLRNGRSVVVRINDRGPFTGGRVIDLSRGAAKAIGMINSGVARVRLQVLGR